MRRLREKINSQVCMIAKLIPKAKHKFIESSGKNKQNNNPNACNLGLQHF